MSEQQSPKRRKWLIWLAVIVVGLPVLLYVLYYLFEVVTPQFLPSNF